MIGYQLLNAQFIKFQQFNSMVELDDNAVTLTGEVRRGFDDDEIVSG